MSKNIYRFSVRYGRGFDIESTFSADPAIVSEMMGKEVHFGEVCGKHSDMSAVITPENTVLLTDDPVVVGLFDKYRLASGHNPVAYYLDRRDDT